MAKLTSIFPTKGINDLKLTSLKFFNLESLEVEYEDGKRCPPKEFKEGLKKMDFMFTTFARVCYKDMEHLPKPLIEKLEPGQILTTIKYVCHLNEDTNGGHFFYSYKGYEASLDAHQKLVNETCSSVENIKKYRVQSVLEVPMGGIFGLRLDGKYVRVRVVKIDIPTSDITYWAVDVGKLGQCKPKDLLHLSGACLELDMLLVPGIFAQDPAPNQLKKFEEKKFCLAKVTQPTYSFDIGPRKIYMM